MNSKFRSGIVVALVMALVAGFSAPALSEATTSTVNEKYQVDMTIYNPCTGNGIAISGVEHDQYHITEDGAGGYHVHYHANLAGVSGVDVVTGDKYQVVGEVTQEMNLKAGEETTIILNEQFVGPGPDNNFVIKERVHITINPDGTVTSSHESFTTECR